MRIDSSTIGMESARSYQASTTSVRRFVITEYQQAFNTFTAAGEEQYDETAAADQDKSAEILEDTENVQESTLERFWDMQNRYGVKNSTVGTDRTGSNMVNDLRQITIRYIFDMLFAQRRGKLHQWMEEQGLTDTYQYNGRFASAEYAGQLQQKGQQPKALFLTVKKLNLVEEDTYTEMEETSFSTVGTVRTADGREINFNVQVGMSRAFSEYYREDLEMASFTMCDPLVINLDTDVAALDDQKFYFDIDADGQEDEISTLSAESGYLALDRNADGVINDGSELFGTKSGNGFADLAAYDSDGNGWIDEGDEIWDKLKIWYKDEKGEDVLCSLKDKGVGAICLQNASTDFSLRSDDQSRTLGAIRNSGIFLYENGNVGTIQHVDVAKYDSQA